MDTSRQPDSDGMGWTYARALFEAYRDGPQYAVSGRPNLRLYRERYEAAKRRVEELDRRIARRLAESRVAVPKHRG